MLSLRDLPCKLTDDADEILPMFHSIHGLMKMNATNWPAPNVWIFIAQLVEHCSTSAGQAIFPCPPNTREARPLLSSASRDASTYSLRDAESKLSALLPRIEIREPGTASAMLGRDALE